MAQNDCSKALVLKTIPNTVFEYKDDTNGI